MAEALLSMLFGEKEAYHVVEQQQSSLCSTATLQPYFNSSIASTSIALAHFGMITPMLVGVSRT